MDAATEKLKYSDAAAEARLAPSRRGAWMIAGAALATLAVIATTPGLDGLRVLAATWIACGALEAIHSRALLRGARAVHALRIRGESIEVVDARGRLRAGSVRPGSFVAPWLTIVRWRPHGAWWDRSIPILPGMAGEEALRRLRVVLKWAQHA